MISREHSKGKQMADQKDTQKQLSAVTNTAKFGGDAGNIMRKKAFLSVLVLPLSGMLLFGMGLFSMTKTDCRYSLELKINFKEISIKIEEDNSKCPARKHKITEENQQNSNL